MKSFVQILLHYFRFQRLVAVLAAIGLALIVLSLPASVISGHTAFGLAIYGFIALYAIPLLASPGILRGLIANRRLALVPGLQLRAGIAQFCLVFSAAAFLPLSHALYLDAPLFTQAALNVFSALSAYVLFMQIALPSRYVVQIMSLMPFALFLGMRAMNDTGLAQWLFMGSVSGTLALAALAGWAVGLRILATRSRYRPAQRALQQSSDWLYWDAGRLERYWQPMPKSPAGTLLLGSSDSLSGRLLPIVNLTLFTPLFSIVLLTLLGFGEQFGAVSPALGLATFFLVLSGASAFCNVLRYEDLAARGRLLWLRLGGDRPCFWRFLEGVVLADFALLCGVCLLIGVATALLVPGAGEFALHYWLVTLCGGLFGLYFSLLCQIREWGGVAKAVGWSAAGLLIGICVSVALVRDWPTLAFGAQAVLLAMALLCRAAGRDAYARIDWRRILPKTPARLREAV